MKQKPVKEEGSSHQCVPRDFLRPACNARAMGPSLHVYEVLVYVVSLRWRALAGDTGVCICAAESRSMFPLSTGRVGQGMKKRKKSKG